MKANIWLAALLLGVSGSSWALDVTASAVWARATAPMQETAMVDVTLTSQQAAALVGVATPAASSAELHSMVHENGVMKMREVKAIDLPAGKAVTLGKAGYHVMLLGLKAPLQAGKRVPLTLTIKAGQETVKLEVSAEIEPLTSDENHHHHH